MSSPRMRLIFGIALLAGITFLAYAPAMRNGFIWDDDYYVTGNLTLRSLAGLKAIWSGLHANPQFYPLVHTTYWVEYHLWGTNPLGYHVVNMALHTLAAILAWRLLALLGVPGAWLAAAIFAVHPVEVESVAWVTERKNVLSGVFYLLAFLTYLRFEPPGISEAPGEPGGPEGARRRRPWGLYILSVAFFVLALLSKTVAATLPAAVLLVLWWKRGRIRWRDVLLLLPFFVIGAAMGGLTGYLERNYVGARGDAFAFSWIDRCLIAGRAVWFYAGKLFWPHPLIFIYPRWGIDTHAWWQYLFPAAAVALVLTALFLRRRWGRGPATALLFFGGTLVPALGFVNVYPMLFSFVADHFQYLASLGLITLAAAAWTHLTRRHAELRHTGAAVLLLVLVTLTWRQAHAYRDAETLWRDTLAKNPHATIARTDLGLILQETGRLKEARQQYDLAIQLEPRDANSYYNLANVLRALGEQDDAIAAFRQSLAINPQHASAHNNLAELLARRGQWDGTIENFRLAAELNPTNALWAWNLAESLAHQGRKDEAAKAYNDAAAAGWGDPDLLLHVGAAQARLGRYDDAIRCLTHAVELRPRFAAAYDGLGVALGSQGHIEQAIEKFQQALAIQQDFADAKAHLEQVRAMRH